MIATLQLNEYAVIQNNTYSYRYHFGSLRLLGVFLGVKKWMVEGVDGYKEAFFFVLYTRNVVLCVFIISHMVVVPTIVTCLTYCEQAPDKQQTFCMFCVLFFSLCEF